jgi:hypothetical protein
VSCSLDIQRAERIVGRIAMSEEKHSAEADLGRAKRIKNLEEKLNKLADGKAVFWTPPECPAGIQESNLENILAFESVESGISLFEGLQLHGTKLPPPRKLDELQSQRKVMEILNALAALGIFLIGFDTMSACELYSTLWNQTLWEGCYVKKNLSDGICLIDVSHKMTQSEILEFIGATKHTNSIH